MWKYEVLALSRHVGLAKNDSSSIALRHRRLILCCAVPLLILGTTSTASADGVLQNIVNAVVTGAHDTGVAVQQGAHDTGAAIQQGAHDTGAAIQQGARDTGSAINTANNQLHDEEQRGFESLNENLGPVANGLCDFFTFGGYSAGTAHCTINGDKKTTGNNAPGYSQPHEDSGSGVSFAPTTPDEPSGSGVTRVVTSDQVSRSDAFSAGYQPVYEHEYPGRYSRTEHPKGVKDTHPVVTYKRLDQRLGEVFDHFAAPTSSALIRLSRVDDPEGGELTSPRRVLDDPQKKNDANERAVSAWGKDDARRVHGGFDFLAAPGEPIVATMSGTIAPPVNLEYGLKGVTIIAPDQTEARVLYIDSAAQLKEGMHVEAGRTLLGHAQNLAYNPHYAHIPNHVHTDFIDGHGRRFDPWSHDVVDEHKLLGQRQ
ncbi:hypothetical protein [Paraburkholderia domus]|uniref:Uncharacterized protein n=1 Tax=Paraburkholderia domus TaxID=2793075 RepID=A0A9N8R6J4_9BURK|nr:hypothetical protein [Paraburkholderia domus]CAE6967988.1 hypothetical protein R70211_07548 [Paraburkholderia domus]